MVSVLTLSEIDRGSSPYRVKFIFVGSLLSMQHSGHRAMTGWLRNQDNVSKWGDMSIRGMLFQ